MGKSFTVLWGTFPGHGVMAQTGGDTLPGKKQAEHYRPLTQGPSYLCPGVSRQIVAACLNDDVLLGDDAAGQASTLRVILPEGEDREGLARHQIAEAAKIFDDMHTVAFAVPVHLLVFRVTADAGTVDNDETYSPGQQGVDELRG